MLGPVLLLLGTLACSQGNEPAGGQDAKSAAPAGSGKRMVLVDFNGPKPPVNQAGTGYPTYYHDPNNKIGGIFTTGLNTSDAIAGRSLQINLNEGTLYAQFNPFDPRGNRAFARDYCANPAGWQFNTYNRLRFWIKRPTTASPMSTGGQPNMAVGTYVKRIADADARSDETGGNHYYHLLNIPATATWVQVILNMHPDHVRGASGFVEHGVVARPTGEPQYNYFDALTRFYIEDGAKHERYPAVYLFDEFGFYQEPREENDAQVFSLTGTYVPSEKRVIVTWKRNKNENTVKHEVRYAFTDIHESGWAKAKPAPQGVVAPAGQQGYNGIYYDTKALPLGNQEKVYIAIKPQNAKTFSQIVIPLTLDKKAD
jgi:hypothetical protein